MNIEIKPLSRSTIQEQLVVYRAAFSASKNDSTWIKKHYENPLGDSLVFGAYNDGQLVGMNAYMPVKYMFQGEAIPMLQSCESGVLPDYQGKGIWSKVVRYAIDYIFTNTKYKAVIGFPNYVNSYPGFKKMGWETLLGMDNYVMVNNAKAFAKAMFSDKKLLQIIGRGIALQKFLASLVSLFKHYVIEECSVGDLLWDDDPNVLSVTHTDSLVEWKKSYKDIKTITIKNNDVTVATCIYGLSEYNGAIIIKIEKIVPVNTNAKLKLVVAAILQYFEKQYRQVAFVRVWTMPNSYIKKALKTLLFFKSSHPNPFIIKQPGNEFVTQKWNLSFFDLD